MHRVTTRRGRARMTPAYDTNVSTATRRKRICDSAVPAARYVTRDNHEK